MGLCSHNLGETPYEVIELPNEPSAGHGDGSYRRPGERTPPYLRPRTARGAGHRADIDVDAASKLVQVSLENAQIDGIVLSARVREKAASPAKRRRKARRGIIGQISKAGKWLSKRLRTKRGNKRIVLTDLYAL